MVDKKIKPKAVSVKLNTSTRSDRTGYFDSYKKNIAFMSEWRISKILILTAGIRTNYFAVYLLITLFYIIVRDNSIVKTYNYLYLRYFITCRYNNMVFANYFCSASMHIYRVGYRNKSLLLFIIAVYHILLRCTSYIISAFCVSFYVHKRLTRGIIYSAVIWAFGWRVFLSTFFARSFKTSTEWQTHCRSSNDPVV